MKRRGTSAKADCPRCGSDDVNVVTYSDTVDFRGLELDVSGLHERKCADCGHIWKTDDDQRHNMAVVKEEYARQRDLIRARNGMLSSTEILAIREQLKLTQKEASDLFGGGPNAFNKYESGEVLQSQAMDKLLRIAAALGPIALDLIRHPRAQKVTFANVDMRLDSSHAALMTSAVTLGDAAITQPYLTYQASVH